MRLIAEHRSAKIVEYPAVYCVLWDHSRGPADSNHPIKVELFGILKKETDLAYYICNFICNSDLHDASTDLYCILKSAVVSLQQIDKRRLSRDIHNANAKRYSKRKNKAKRGRVALTRAH